STSSRSGNPAPAAPPPPAAPSPRPARAGRSRPRPRRARGGPWAGRSGWAGATAGTTAPAGGGRRPRRTTSACASAVLSRLVREPARGEARQRDALVGRPLAALVQAAALPAGQRRQRRVGRRPLVQPPGGRPGPAAVGAQADGHLLALDAGGVAEQE